jgi:hypothetical protein
MEADDRLLIGQAARAARVNVETLRYYERRRLVRPPRRDLNGYRAYDADSVRLDSGPQSSALAMTVCRSTPASM